MAKDTELALSAWRQAVAWLLAGALLWSVHASIPNLEWNVQLWNRLRAAHRTSPDDGLDQEYGALRERLPGGDVVGFQFSATPDDGRTLFRLRYALVPIRIELTPGHEFVIEVGPASGVGSLMHDAGFVLNHEVDEGLRVMRRVPR